MTACLGIVFVLQIDFLNFLYKQLLNHSYRRLVDFLQTIAVLTHSGDATLRIDWKPREFDEISAFDLGVDSVLLIHNLRRSTHDQEKTR